MTEKMNKIFEELLARIPDYKVFLTVDELNQNSKKLAEKYPDVVSVFGIGSTKDGEEIPCLKIEGGEKVALLFGCPHPNEPIGTMMLEYLSENLASNEEFRKEFGYTVYIVKAWDADGLRKNERWLKGPFDVFNYSRYFFRPAGHQQVEWTFPVDYKELHFHDSIPETKAMIKLIDDIKPHFMYSLHNAGFGGVYWYISEELKPLYDKMRSAAARVSIALHLGEPEAPYLEALSPAIYRSLGIEQDYDYLEKYGAKNIAEIINAGNCSESYARERYGSFTLLTELPYFYDERIMDLSEGNKSRRQCILEKLENQKVHNKYVRDILESTKEIVSEKNQYRMALVAFTKDENIDSTVNMVNTNEEYSKKATVAEAFDNEFMSKFYNLLSYGMIIGMCESEIKSSDIDDEKMKKLKEIITKNEVWHKEKTEELEKHLNYKAIPIRKLVSIQLECGLLVADYLRDKEALKH